MCARNVIVCSCIAMFLYSSCGCDADGETRESPEVQVSIDASSYGVDYFDASGAGVDVLLGRNKPAGVASAVAYFRKNFADFTDDQQDRMTLAFNLEMKEFTATVGQREVPIPRDAIVFVDGCKLLVKIAELSSVEDSYDRDQIRSAIRHYVGDAGVRPGNCSTAR
jgi:hypothetical protein